VENGITNLDRTGARHFTMLVDSRATISVRSLSPFGERVGVRGIQNYRESLTLTPAPSQPKSDLSDFGQLQSAELG
jgi:hypothetical protein